MGTDAGSVGFSGLRRNRPGLSPDGFPSHLFCSVAEEALRLISRRLPESLESRYTDFLFKYLRACLTEISVNNKPERIVFQDDRRHIYYYGPPKETLVEKVALSAARVTLSVFERKPKRRKNSKQFRRTVSKTVSETVLKTVSKTV